MHITAALAESYGLDVMLERLPGENLNYLVTTPAGQRFVAKLAADDQPSEFVEMEHRALRHAAARLPDLRLPLILENRYGNIESFLNAGGSLPKRLRLIEFVAGASRTSRDISESLRFALGCILAEFDHAMADFKHPAAHRVHRWNLLHVEQHRPKVELIADREQRSLLRSAHDQFTKNASPVLNTLERQFIHGDGNPENILVDGERIVGLLDFGDCGSNPPVCELAICLAYEMMDQSDPWAAAAPVIAGWESVRPLTATERGILPSLIVGRLANTLSVAAARRQIDPGNANWFVSEQKAWNLLRALFKNDVV